MNPKLIKINLLRLEPADYGSLLMILKNSDNKSLKILLNRRIVDPVLRKSYLDFYIVCMN